MGFSFKVDIPGVGPVGATSGSPPTDFTKDGSLNNNREKGDAGFIGSLLNALGLGNLLGQKPSAKPEDQKIEEPSQKAPPAPAGQSLVQRAETKRVENSDGFERFLQQFDEVFKDRANW